MIIGSIIFIIVVLIIIKNFLIGCYCAKKAREWEEHVRIISTADDSQAESTRKIENENKFRYLARTYISSYMIWHLRQIGKIPSQRIRKFILRTIYRMHIAKTAVVYGGFEIRSPWKIKIGEGSIIGDESKLDGRNGLIIGENVNFSTGVWIWTEQHDYNDEFFRTKNKGGKVVIENRAWISCRTIVLPGVTIGEGACVAAGAVVTKNIEPYSVYGGVPAKKIAKRNNELKYVFEGKYTHFI